MLCFKHALITFVAVLLVPSFLHSQAAEGPLRVTPPSAHTYQNSAEDLRLLLQDVLAATRAGDLAKLMSFVKQMEIPNYEAWFTKTFGQEAGAGWAGSYGRDLPIKETEFQDMFVRMAKQVGEITARNVNEKPDSARSPESGMIDLLQRPMDIFFAGWKEGDSTLGSPIMSIGYFVFVEGKFRWISTVSILTIKRRAAPADTESEDRAESTGGSNDPSSKNGPVPAGIGGVTYPSCDYCPGPSYPRKARAEHAEGTVVLRAVIQTDGRATDIQVVKTPRADFADQAIETVRTWRFKPAIGPTGDPVAVIAPIEVTFRLEY
jgi:TonB family protein